MWFVFPQIAGLGRTQISRFFAIADRAEGQAYAAHPVLGHRLRECTDALLRWAGQRDAESILGPIDALKLRSSMTLFEACAADPAPFAAVLDAFCGGQRDEMTLERL